MGSPSAQRVGVVFEWCEKCRQEEVCTLVRIRHQDRTGPLSHYEVVCDTCQHVSGVLPLHYEQVLPDASPLRLEIAERTNPAIVSIDQGEIERHQRLRVGGEIFSRAAIHFQAPDEGVPYGTQCLRVLTRFALVLVGMVAAFSLFACWVLVPLPRFMPLIAAGSTLLLGALSYFYWWIRRFAQRRVFKNRFLPELAAELRQRPFTADELADVLQRLRKWGYCVGSLTSPEEILRAAAAAPGENALP